MSTYRVLSVEFILYRLPVRFEVNTELQLRFTQQTVTPLVYHLVGLHAHVGLLVVYDKCASFSDEFLYRGQLLDGGLFLNLLLLTMVIGCWPIIEFVE